MKKNKNIKLLEKLGLLINIILTITLITVVVIRTNQLMNIFKTEYQVLIIILAGLIFYLTLYIQLIIHELGHLIFGLISKYKFSSFRIGNLILVKNNKKIKLKLLKISGTGGQCIMIPPKSENGKIPVILYNLGGALANIITAFIFIIFHIIVNDKVILAYIFDTLALFGIYFAALNGIPMKMGIIDNDGFNAISLSKDKSAQKAFLIQLKINEALSNNKRLKEMPAEWFEIDKNANLNNSLIAAILVLSCNRLLDEHEFKKANKKMDTILKKETAIVGLHYNLLICDRIYCCLLENNVKEVKKLYNEATKNFMTSMKNYPSIIRTNYALSLLLDKDQTKANTYLKKFQKCAKTHPYPSDIISEKELISIATAMTRQ